jgi:hypothetical protein
MLNRTRAAAIALLATTGLALTACGGTNKVAGEATSSSASAPAATTTSAAAPTTTPAPAPTAFTLGQAQHWSGEGHVGTTTVLSYKQPVLQDDPPGTSLGVPTGSQWGRIDVKVCLTSGPNISVSQQPWHVMFKDGSQIDTTGESGGDFPKPEFPQDGQVSAGACARGGIMFPIPKGQRPAQIVYSPDSRPTPVYWTIPAK